MNPSNETVERSRTWILSDELQRPKHAMSCTISAPPNAQTSLPAMKRRVPCCVAKSRIRGSGPGSSKRQFQSNNGSKNQTESNCVCFEPATSSKWQNGSERLVRRGKQYKEKVRRFFTVVAFLHAEQRQRLARSRGAMLERPARLEALRLFRCNQSADAIRSLAKPAGRLFWQARKYNCKAAPEIYAKSELEQRPHECKSQQVKGTERGQSLSVM